MSPWGSPARGTLALARAPVTERPERRALLLWRGMAAAVSLAAYTVAGVVAAALALYPIAGHPVAGRRPSTGAEEPGGPGQQALPG